MPNRNHDARVNAQTQFDMPIARVEVELQLAAGVSMYINTGNSQNQGSRPYQEDSFGYSNLTDSGVVSGKGLLAVLSDGMGGLQDGKSVADYVVQSSIAMFNANGLNPRDDIGMQLNNIFCRINESICEKYSSIGTNVAGATAVLAYIFKNRIYWLTVGDSRLYCFREGHLLQMNEDHDYKNHLYREYIDEGGSISEIEADPQKDSLVCFVGTKDIPHIDIGHKGYRIKPNDIFVLCSDGIYNGITKESMEAILSSCENVQEASDRIVSEVLAAGFPGQDNMTVMVIKCRKN